MKILTPEQKSFLKKIIPLAAFVAGLCCFSSVILVLLGLSTVTFAASLSDTLYGQYKWLFRLGGLLILLIALAWYFYKKEKVCTIDAVKRKRKKIINFVIITLVVGVIAYVIWLYVIVEIIGLLLGIWG